MKEIYLTNTFNDSELADGIIKISDEYHEFLLQKIREGHCFEIGFGFTDEQILAAAIILKP